jgi:hypothetical protein
MFTCNPAFQSTAGMSFKLLKANLESNIILKHLNKEDYNNIRGSLVGGRCISLNGIYENISFNYLSYIIRHHFI